MRGLIVMLLSATLAAPAFAACPPEGQSRESLQALKLLKFTVPDVVERQTLANGLLDCLGDPDPALRDGIAYEALTQWMRADQLDAEGLRALRDRLYAMLAAEDATGFAKPFAALTLSEIARTDRIKSWMAPEERAAMVNAAGTFVESVRDYRGYDDTEGWRHGLAHGADWMMQLALNPVLDRAQLDRLLASVATQVVPETPHAYIFGEPGRLARPVLYAAKRGLYTEAEWQAWFTALVPKLGEASKAYNDSAWLARRHNLMAFLMSVYLDADQSDDVQLKQLKPAVVAALKTVP